MLTTVEQRNLRDAKGLALYPALIYPSCCPGRQGLLGGARICDKYGFRECGFEGQKETIIDRQNWNPMIGVNERQLNE